MTIGQGAVSKIRVHVNEQQASCHRQHNRQGLVQFQGIGFLTNFAFALTQLGHVIYHDDFGIFFSVVHLRPRLNKLESQKFAFNANLVFFVLLRRTDCHVVRFRLLGRQ